MDKFLIKTTKSKSVNSTNSDSVIQADSEATIAKNLSTNTSGQSGIIPEQLIDFVESSKQANTDEISLDKIPTDLANKNEDPKQPKLPFYPVTKSQVGTKGEHNRSFNYDWFSLYPTLEYSVKLDAVFCFCCRHFTQSSNAEDCFIKNGFKNWKKFHEKFRAHIDTFSHVKIRFLIGSITNKAKVKMAIFWNK